MYGHLSLPLQIFMQHQTTIHLINLLLIKTLIHKLEIVSMSRIPAIIS